MQKYEVVLAVLDECRTKAGYRRAKRLAEGCDVVEQFALIDAFIAARRRLGG